MGAFDFEQRDLTLGLRSVAEEFKQRDLTLGLRSVAEEFNQRACPFCSLFTVHSSLPPFPLFEVNAARRLRATLTISVSS